MIVGVVTIHTMVQADETSFANEEDLGYTEFVLEPYPEGLLADWCGVHISYLPEHEEEPEGDNKNHFVNSEASSLLAQLALLRGDRETLDKVIALWFDTDRHYSSKFKLAHWLLDPDGDKHPVGGELRNASGEEARMLEVLTSAYERFGDTGTVDYLGSAAKIAEGMKGANSQGVFEPAHPEPPHPFVFKTDEGSGGVETIETGRQPVQLIRLDLRRRNTPYGYSLLEVEAYGPDDPDMMRNLALFGTARASSIEGPDYEPENAIDGDPVSRWASEPMVDPQWFELDLGQPRVVEKVVLQWETASALEYELSFTPAYEPQEADGFLLRPWLAWDPTSEAVISQPWDPHRVALNVNNFVGYHKVATLLGETFYKDVLRHTITTILGCQSPDTGMFRPQYDLLLHECFDEFGRNECTVLACADIATRLGAYAHLIDDPPLVEAGRAYLDFLKDKYWTDGVAWFSYDHDNGTPVDLFTGLSVYVFFAKMAIEYRDWDLAEKIFREQILPRQVSESTDHPSLVVPGLDVALREKVSVSTVQPGSPDLLGRFAVDDDDGTRWGSEHGIDPQWIYVDLGEPHWVAGVEILWETAFATRYEVQVAGDPGRLFCDGFESGDGSRWSSGARYGGP